MRVRQALAIRLNDVTEVSIHALMRVRPWASMALIINSATGVLRQPPMGSTKIPGRKKR